MSLHKKSLVVEGWRGVNHSFAMVNQFQLLEMVKRPEIALYHRDAPFHFGHWSPSTNGPGFHQIDESTITFVADATDISPDWTYRIFSPVDLRSPEHGGRLAVFLVTELGLDEQSFVQGSDIKSFEAAGHIIITPSQWSRDRVVDFGFRPETVHVVPHAASPHYFMPLSAEINLRQRVALGFRADEVILLNIGAAIWNKGIDVLLKGFALARQKRKDLRLIFKDQRSTYGLNGDSYVQSTLASMGLSSDETLQAITMIPANLTMDQMNSMYGLADCYVSPYRAEGFNLPVCEAMACGTPVIVTEGGATDDFVFGSIHRKIRSTLHRNSQIQHKHVSGYCEPDMEHLVSLLTETQSKPASQQPQSPRGVNAEGWAAPVDSLLNLLH